MKGIKECSNWLFDNPGNMLQSVDKPSDKRRIVFGKRHLSEVLCECKACIEDEGYTGIYWVDSRIDICMSVLEDEEWEPMKEE